MPNIDGSVDCAMTQQEVADRLGITIARVGQLERRALQKLLRAGQGAAVEPSAGEPVTEFEMLCCTAIIAIQLWGIRSALRDLAQAIRPKGGSES